MTQSASTEHANFARPFRYLAAVRKGACELLVGDVCLVLACKQTSEMSRWSAGADAYGLLVRLNALYLTRQQLEPELTPILRRDVDKKRFFWCICVESPLTGGAN